MWRSGSASDDVSVKVAGSIPAIPSPPDAEEGSPLGFIPTRHLAGLAQVAFGQTQAFHLGTWSERPTFNREVRSSSLRVGTTKSFRRGN